MEISVRAALRRNGGPTRVRSGSEEMSVFASAIEDGVTTGAFTCDAPRETARALHAMCSAVTGWYRTDGPMSPDHVAELYVGMALRLVGARELAPTR